MTGARGAASQGRSRARLRERPSHPREGCRRRWCVSGLRMCKPSVPVTEIGLHSVGGAPRTHGEAVITSTLASSVASSEKRRAWESRATTRVRGGAPPRPPRPRAGACGTSGFARLPPKLPEARLAAWSSIGERRGAAWESRPATRVRGGARPRPRDRAQAYRDELGKMRMLFEPARATRSAPFCCRHASHTTFSKSTSTLSRSRQREISSSSVTDSSLGAACTSRYVERRRVRLLGGLRVP